VYRFHATCVVLRHTRCSPNNRGVIAMRGNMSSHAYDVFISYQSGDLKLAEDLHQRLVEQGFRVWFDKARLSPGCNWHTEIEAGCEASRVLLPIVTPRWRTSEWTKFETYGAETVIPLHYEGEWNAVATPPLMRYQAFDFRNPATADWTKFFASIRTLLAQPAPQKAERIAHLRYWANPYFVGREVELNTIHEALHRNPTAALTQGSVQAIAALGGVGKTTLARQYAEKFWRLYPQMFWVDARTNLVSEFARLAEILKPGLAITDEAEKARLALRILNDRTPRLLILDNAEDEEAVQAWIPKIGGCHTIITSRFTAWSAAIATCYIDVLEPGPARQLLLKRAGREPTPANNAACDRLAEKLGWLPLALEQAAAYIREQGPDFSFEDYLRLYDQATHDLLAEGVLGSTEYPDSVITTWKATIAKLAPSARAILRLSAFLAPELIPTEMLIKSAAMIRERATEFTETVRPDQQTTSSSDELYVRNGLKNLFRYAMITTHGQEFSVHALLQTVERFDTPDPRRPGWIEQAVETVATYGPENAHDYRTWPIWNQLQSHAALLWEEMQADSRVKPNLKLLTGLEHLYFGKGLYAKTLLIAQKALEIEERSLDPDHADIASRLLTVGESLRVMNRLTEAEPLFRRAIEIKRKHYGPNHQEVASSINYLAMVLEGMSKFEEAEKLYQQALEIYKAADDPNQSDLVKCLINLASLYKEMGKYVQAEPLCQQVIEIFRTFLGEDHPNYPLALLNLAQLYGKMGNYAAAEPLCQQALGIWRTALGENHPYYAISLNEIAFHVYVPKHNWNEAEKFYRRAIELMATQNNEIELANMQLNLCTVLHQSGKAVDDGEVRRLTELLEQAHDKRAEKGKKILQDRGA